MNSKNRMPDGSFAVDKNTLQITREVKTPYIPVIKLKDGVFDMTAPERVADYLYYVEFSDWDYDYASERLLKQNMSIGACSSVRKGNYYGRHYDWTYDEKASFVIKCKAVKGRHASIGVCSSRHGLTDDFVKSGEPSDDYRILPFITVDGINDAGVVCNINILPEWDVPATTGSNPDGEDLIMNMVVRYILDYADSAAHAVELLSSANVISPTDGEFKEQFHWMIADAEDTYIVEFIGNEISVLSYSSSDKAIMTNFPLTGFDGNTATAYYKAADFDKDTTTLTPHAMGLERFDILSDGYDDVTNKADMIDLMGSVKYTTAYSDDADPFWYSEFTGIYDGFELDYESQQEDFTAVVAYAKQKYTEHKRDGSTWQTVHCSVYDIANKTLDVSPQESGEHYIFSLSKIGSDESTLALTSPNGTRYIVTVSDDGVLSATPVAD